jgi:hypothetical protein
VGDVWPPSAGCAPWREHVQRGGQTILHAPSQPWLAVVGRGRADGAARQQLNPRRRPETARAAAWGRAGVAEPSTSTRVLEACTPLAVAPRRTARAQRDRHEGWARHPPGAPARGCWAIARTGLPAGGHAAARTKGYFSGEKTRMVKKLMRLRAHSISGAPRAVHDTEAGLHALGLG